MISIFKKRQAFTLAELLTVVAILSILLVGASLGSSALLKQARSVREIAAGKTLISAYYLYANDHNRNLIPAIDKTAGSKETPVWFKPENRNITFMEAPHRYPFRLAPYFDYQLRNVLLFNGQEKKIDEIFGKSGGLHDYGISLCPAFGINYRFCGGYVEPSGELDYPSQVEAVARLNQVGPSILVFASAGGRPDENTYLEGYFKVDAPTFASAPWSSAPWKEGTNAADYGAVDARHGGKAVCAFLDGSVRLLTIEQLRDMRLWSRNAADRNDPNYVAAQ